jgi:hypothetical protein
MYHTLHMTYKTLNMESTRVVKSSKLNRTNSFHILNGYSNTSN